ncbi:conserved hypothetical protein [Methylocella tundrae]|uniref:Uncharacterized protein n=1 Tax=Methylocella tundrae TaxID=227605 RepID=A0A8B6M1R9_METTU|nr:hypothetical protein [Methylocella tundrae]VTZ48778.1 conserved hypothetical protein [Methylocella tundrae]
MTEGNMCVGESCAEDKERIAIHLDVHLHLMIDPLRTRATYPQFETVVDDIEAPLPRQSSSAEAGRKSGFLGKSAIAAIVGLVIVFAYKAGGAGAAFPPAGPVIAPATRSAAAGDSAPASKPVAAELPRELLEAPRVTPAPGAPSAGAPAAPSAFGLN